MWVWLLAAVGRQGNGCNHDRYMRMHFYYIDFVYTSEYELVYVYIEPKEYNFIQHLEFHSTKYWRFDIKYNKFLSVNSPWPGDYIFLQFVHGS